MIGYEVLKSLDISYRNKSETIDGYTNINSIYLDVGDFIFLEGGYWGRVEVRDINGRYLSSNFEQTYVLKKILYKSTKMFRDEKGEIDFYKVWEEEDNMNLFNPLINRNTTIDKALERGLIVESLAWKREMKLNELLK